jgi:RimJ/RimL family protein N-acetyltransferase
MSEPSVAAYLSDGVIGLRTPVVDDAVFAHRWYDGPAEHGRDEVEAELRRQESIPWGGNPVLRLIAVDLSAGESVAGVTVTRSSNRTSRLLVRCPEGSGRAGLLERILAMVVEWLIQEVGLMTVVMQADADDTALIKAAESAGMRTAVRRREHLRRDGHRVDLLDLERVNLEWGRYAG